MTCFRRNRPRREIRRNGSGHDALHEKLGSGRMARSDRHSGSRCQIRPNSVQTPCPDADRRDLGGERGQSVIRPCLSASSTTTHPRKRAFRTTQSPIVASISVRGRIRQIPGLQDGRFRLECEHRFSFVRSALAEDARHAIKNNADCVSGMAGC